MGQCPILDHFDLLGTAKSWGPASDGWLRMAVVAALGNPGSGKASECPGVQLSPVPYAEASAGPLRERFTTFRSCGDQLEVFIYVV